MMIMESLVGLPPLSYGNYNVFGFVKLFAFFSLFVRRPTRYRLDARGTYVDL